MDSACGISIFLSLSMCDISDPQGVDGSLLVAIEKQVRISFSPVFCEGMDVMLVEALVRVYA